mmetsp:Transcript_19754/g.57301  ORF Transcript_19754/g.57301 Transcript_19754/m.57301 type:complete len:234 (+) Transcript_19754:282-983(+)
MMYQSACRNLAVDMALAAPGFSSSSPPEARSARSTSSDGAWARRKSRSPSSSRGPRAFISSFFEKKRPILLMRVTTRSKPCASRSRAKWPSSPSRPSTSALKAELGMSMPLASWILASISRPSRSPSLLPSFLKRAVAWRSTAIASSPWPVPARTFAIASIIRASSILSPSSTRRLMPSSAACSAPSASSPAASARTSARSAAASPLVLPSSLISASSPSTRRLASTNWPFPT